ncbi:MAG TPA: sigma factor-like helix-turn-helix DNA-binding protein [Streptosporangiaceae bacterium]
MPSTSGTRSCGCWRNCRRGQRTVVVLRYWEQLSEAETAAILGCSPGSVKSAASRGMSRLRELAGDRPPKLPIPPRRA